MGIGVYMDKSGNKNILIIDDTNSITVQMDILLSKIGYNVTICHDVISALDAFDNNHFAFITADLLIPTEQDGYELLKSLKNKIKSDNIDTRIIVLSARSKSEQENICKRLGADYYIEKDENWQTELTNIIDRRI